VIAKLRLIGGDRLRFVGLKAWYLLAHWPDRKRVTAQSCAARSGSAGPPATPAIGKPTLCMIDYNGERYLRDSLQSAVAQTDRFGRRWLDAVLSMYWKRIARFV
jgi:hypothetical protein